MANLEKIIKVTQEQYDILASGGKVGDYVGLQDNYVYMIEDTNEYITTAGGTIDGPLTIAPKTAGSPLTLHYANDEDYFLSIYPNPTDNTNIYTIDVENNAAGAVSLSLPQKSGTLALTSDIPTVSLTTTAGSEAITVNSDSLNVATTDTDQTISSNKTIAYGSKTSYTLNNGNVYDLSGNQYNYLQIGYNGIGMYSFGNAQFFPNSNNSRDLGTKELSWRNLYLAQNLSDGTNSITVAEIVAKQDAVKVKRYI